MTPIIEQILEQALGETSLSISEIVGFGTVNKVFAVQGKRGDYIIRLNQGRSKEIEYLKEEWCLRAVKELGVPVPKVLGVGIYEEYTYIIQDQIKGTNGSTCNDRERVEIWRSLGEYAARFHTITQIAVAEVQEAEFHDNWRKKIAYNMGELHAEDPLLRHQHFTALEHQQLKQLLFSLQQESFEVGLVHGDLSPRNVIVDEATIHLLDWGTAEINIVPYTEIGIVLLGEEANEREFAAFLAGLKIDEIRYQAMRPTILKLNVLHRLDKYRWATDHDQENLHEFVEKLRTTYETTLL